MPATRRVTPAGIDPLNAAAVDVERTGHAHRAALLVGAQRLLDDLVGVLPERTRGVRSSAIPARSWNSVWVKPGASTITLTPVPRSSSWTALVKLLTNAFVAP